MRSYNTRRFGGVHGIQAAFDEHAHFMKIADGTPCLCAVAVANMLFAPLRRKRIQDMI